MTDWQPIETAPNDETRVDIWLTDETGRGWRETDAYWRTDAYEEYSDYSTGQHQRLNTRRHGWFAPGHDYDGGDGFCDQPVRNYGNPLKPTWIIATHWMPIPDGPKS
jgi:hypothetical protein